MGNQSIQRLKQVQCFWMYSRDLGCYSVKCGCETTNCGLCTVWVDGTPRLSCSILAARNFRKKDYDTGGASGRSGPVRSISGGRRGRAVRILFSWIYHECPCHGTESSRVSGHCPDAEEIREYLAGNLCRCTGYAGQLRAVEKYLRESRG